MKKIIFIVFCLFTILPTISWAQTDTVYIDQLNKKSSKYRAEFFQVYKKGPGDKYQVKKFSMKTKKLESEGTYATIDSESKEGAFVYYDDSGFVSKKGNYTDNKRDGEWKGYYSSGALWYTEHYRNDEPDGELRSYYKSGKLKRKEMHHNSFVAESGTCYDENGKEIRFTPFEVMPKPSFDVPGFLRENLEYPSIARTRNITGRVLTRFIIDKQGSVTDVEIIKHVSPEIDAEAERVISLMPKWSPGMTDDVPVKVYFTQPITFTLE